MKTVPILFTFDEKLIMPACVCMTSLLTNAHPDTFYDIFIIHSDRINLADSAISYLYKHFSNCSMSFIPVKGEFIGAYEVRGIPETAYYRLLSPELITRYDKILYSDVDVIFRDDLSSYYDLDLGTNHFAAVDNCSRLRPDVQDYIKNDLGLDWHDGYFYSGNLVINLEQIRKDGTTATFRNLGRKKFNQQDMDIMNIASNKRILRLSPAFCLTNYLYDLIVTRRKDMEEEFPKIELDYALQRGIIHYNGDKPWRTWCHHYDIWWEYYRKSPVYDEEFYHTFYSDRMNELDRLSLIKRIKILCRFFIYGRK